MSKLLVLIAFVAVFTVAASVKEWKNFENGKVYSHKTPNEKKQLKAHGAPYVEERLLHSHHRDKKIHHQIKSNQLPVSEAKQRRAKNPERHHKKNIEEEMHLRPLNERHHKFPNPAMLNKLQDDGTNIPSPQLSRHKLVKQEAEKRTY